jgi:sugar phosphate permease
MSPLDFWKLIRSNRTVLLCMAAFMCENFTAMVLFTWMPTFLYRKFHLSLALAALTATLYIQVTSMLGSPLGGWLADTLRKRMPGGRMLVQSIGIFCEAPFAVLCALTQSMTWLIASLLLWGVFKGFYEANIFASVFDAIRPEARGTATGFMNMMGWLAGGGSAPVVVGILADRLGLSNAIAITASAYVIASLLLLVAALRFAKPDIERMRTTLVAEAAPAMS